MKIEAKGLRVTAVCAACVGAGALFGPSLVSAAEKVSTVIVGNTDAQPVPTRAIGPTQVTGTVAVGNTDGQPVPTRAIGPTQVTGSVDVNGSVDVASPEFRFGNVLLSMRDNTSDFDIHDIPSDIVLTDLFIERLQSDTASDTCIVVLVNDKGSDEDFLAAFRTTDAEREFQLHLESGLREASPVIRDLELWLTSPCRVRVTYTGYTAE